MIISTRYTELVGIQHPVVQDGLGLSPTAKLAAAVSEAGGLGTVSIPAVSADLGLTARLFRAQIDEAARLTSKPLAVNIPVGTDSSGTVLPFSEPGSQSARGAAGTPSKPKMRKAPQRVGKSASAILLTLTRPIL